MTNARPNALSLAVAFATSSFIMGTQALPERKLQTISVDIQDKGHYEFVQSEVIVKPTLGDDQQPIPKSFTTTYPDLSTFRAVYTGPGISFTDILSVTDGSVSSVDLFETDENDIAQKYTKLLKIGDEGVFRFTHNLAEKQLVIEVRSGMTDQDSVKAVRDQWSGVQSLEPLTKIASPPQLSALLQGADHRAGYLGTRDDFVPLAIIEVEKVEVYERTFMRLIAAGDQPPELKRLGQSLFINDDALLAAATSAYIQVHVLREDIQQQALNELLAHSKPVGYVVQVEDDTQVYPVPAGYPKLEVTGETRGGIIVFRGQKQNPAQAALVERLFRLWQTSGHTHESEAQVSTRIKKRMLNNYQYIIRSRQMAILEELAVQGGIELEDKVERLLTLAYYESLEQALTNAAPPYEVDEFEFTVRHIRVASSVVTSSWVHNQLFRHFGFNPVLRNLLNNQLFIHSIHRVIPAISNINQVQDDAPGDDKQFASKVINNISRQLMEMENKLLALRQREGDITQLRYLMKLATEKAEAIEKEKLGLFQDRQQLETKLAQHRNRMDAVQDHMVKLQQQVEQIPELEKKLHMVRAIAREKKNQLERLEQEVERIPTLEREVQDARDDAIRARNAQTATELGIDDWDETQPLELQARRIREKILKIKPLDATTRQPAEEAAKAKQANIGGKRKITSVNGNTLDDLQSTQEQLDQITGLPDEKVREKLATIEGQLGLTPNHEEDLEARRKAIQWNLKRQAIEITQQYKEEQLEQERPDVWLQKLHQAFEQIPQLEQQVRDTAADVTKARNTKTTDLGFDGRDDTQPMVAAMRQPAQEAANAKQANIGGQRIFTSVNGNTMGQLYSIKDQLLQIAGLPDEKAREKLANIEGRLGLIPNIEDDLKARQQAIKWDLKQQEIEIIQQYKEAQHDQEKPEVWLRKLQQTIKQIPKLEQQVRDAAADATKARNAQIAAELGIGNWNDALSPEEQTSIISQKILENKPPVPATSIIATPFVAPSVVAPSAVAPSAVAPSPVAPSPVAPSAVAPSVVATPFVATSVVATPVARTLVAATPAAITSIPAKDTTEHPAEEAAKEKIAAIESKLNIIPDNENDLETRLQSIHQQLQHEQGPIGRVTRNNLANFEIQLGLVPDNKKDPQVRHQAIREQLKEQVAQIDQELFQAKVKASYATLAAYLNIENFGSSADIEDQEQRLLQKLTTMDAEHKILHKSLKTLRDQKDLEDSFTYARKAALAEVLGIDLNKNSKLEDRKTLERTVHVKLFELAKLEKELKDIRTPGHPEAMPEVLETLSNVEIALEMRNLDESNDVYLRRQAISDDMQAFIRDARQRTEEEALSLLKAAEEILNIKVNEEDDKTTRLTKIYRILYIGDLPDKLLDELDNNLWAYKITARGEKNLKLLKLLAHLHYKIEDPGPGKHATEQQIALLEAVEEILNINFDEEDDKAARLAWVHTVLDDGDISEDTLDRIGQALWKGDSTALSERDLKLKKLRAVLAYKVEDWYLDKHAKEQQTCLLAAVEEKLKIHPHEYVAAKERGEALTAKLAKDLNIAFAEDDNLSDQKDALKAKVQALMDEFDEASDDEGVRRARNNELAHQLSIKDYEEDATINNQNSLIEAKLKELYEAIFNAGQPDINERIATIENDLDKQMARLGSKPRYALDRELARAKGDIEKAKSELESIHRKLDAVYGKQAAFAHSGDTPSDTDYAATDGQVEVDHAKGEMPAIRRKYTQVTNFLREQDLREMELAAYAKVEEKQAQEDLNNKNQDIDESPLQNLVANRKQALLSEAQEAMEDHEGSLKVIEDAMGLKPDSTASYDTRIDALRKKKLELFGDDGSGGKILQLIRQQERLKKEAVVKKANIENMEQVLEAAEEVVRNEGGPFQYTPGQAEILANMYAFIRAHSLKKQALEAAMGLAHSAELSDKPVPDLLTFDFDDEWAPVHLQASVGNDLTFDQARRMVEVFKNLKTTFTSGPEAGPSLSPLKEARDLANRARIYIKSGPQQYDDEIHGMGEAAIYFVDCEARDLKGFSEYFAARSASGNKIITLLREGLISKVELENYITAVRSVDGYQTVDEFEHFLGYGHGIKVADFKAVVRMLSDEGVKEFMQNAFTPMPLTGPAGMKESVAGMKEYAASVIANYVLDDIAFENGRKTAAFLTNVQDTLTPYANAAGMSESELIQIIHGTLMQTHAAAVERQLNDYWIKPSASLVQAVTWYFSSYKPLLVTYTARHAARVSLANMAFLYLLDLTNRGDYLHRMPTPFQNWLERYGVDLDRTDQYAYHSGIEKVSEVGGLAMPLGRAASSVILLKTGSLLFARQYNANPYMYRNIFRLVPDIVKSMGSGQGVQIPLLHRMTPEKVKTLASATAGLVMGPVATAGAYAYGILSRYTYAQTFGFALASSLTFDFFMNDNKMLTQWLGGPLGRSLDTINRWRGVGETGDNYAKRTAIATPQRFNETHEEYAGRVKVNNMMHGWTRSENYLQFRERRDRTMKLFDNGWEKYFRENVPEWSFSHVESIPYSYTLGTFFNWQQSDDKKVSGHDKKMLLKGDDKVTRDEL
ncbi:hypothetical protein [Endozoicomonas sp. ISHI1]|uniref:hypothetical protein n=1 Tax=Endozoicomonas sp. ISHI1 TaxID=2825882 RepID=UPI0021483E0C|nr:hypothetical protein [Endozoicomonas sp. ISHI1]